MLFVSRFCYSLFVVCCCVLFLSLWGGWCEVLVVLIVFLLFGFVCRVPCVVCCSLIVVCCLLLGGCWLTAVALYCHLSFVVGACVLRRVLFVA